MSLTVQEKDWSPMDQVEPFVKCIIETQRAQYSFLPTNDAEKWGSECLAEFNKRFKAFLRKNPDVRLITFADGSEGSSGNTVRLELPIKWDDGKYACDVRICDCGYPDHLFHFNKRPIKA